MKKFSIPCYFNGAKAPFTIYIGAPEPGHHPLHFQADWLSKARGGTIPPEIMDSISKLKDLAEKNNVSFEELCVYALGAAAEEAVETESQVVQPEVEPSQPLPEVQAEPRPAAEPVERFEEFGLEPQTPPTESGPDLEIELSDEEFLAQYKLEHGLVDSDEIVDESNKIGAPTLTQEDILAEHELKHGIDDDSSIPDENRITTPRKPQSSNPFDEA